LGIILILAQIVLIVLVYGAHVVSLSAWITWLPAMLFAAVWLLAIMFHATFAVDRVDPFVPKRRRR